MRRPAALALALVAAALPAAPAAAAPPEPTGFTVTFPAGRYCDFPLLVESTGKVKVLDRDGTVFEASREVLDLTNVDTGATTTVRLGGTYRTTSLADGRTRTLTTGRTLIASQAKGITVLVGRFEAYQDVDGDLDGDFVGSGRVIAVCDQLG